MFPGLTAADCQVAAFRYQQLVNEGQQQQFVAGNLSASVDILPLPTVVRKQLGTLMARAGQRLRGARTGTRDSLGAGAASEQSAVA
jgi:hypothetical protein